MPDLFGGDRDEGDGFFCPVASQSRTRYTSRCWKKQTGSQQKQCCVCRQFNVDDLTFIAVAMLCGEDDQRATVADLTPVGKSLLEKY